MTTEGQTQDTKADPLGHDHYAATLWARIEQALDTEDPGDDPLVIGIFGEWGTGKSHLLELILRRAQVALREQCRIRADNGANVDAPLVLTIPVFFHPWKYEHEPQLAVPLLMHIADALGKAWKYAQTPSEWFVEDAKQAGKSVEEFVGAMEKAGTTFGKAVSVVKNVADVMGNRWVKTIVGAGVGWVSAGTVPPEVTKGVLDKIATSAKELLSDDEGETKPAEKSAGDRKTSSATPDDKSFAFADDGSFYYRIHEELKKLTRIDPAKPPAGLKDRIRFPVRTNFVVFVDDLDRCLPEKAVEVLELIKTLLNVESFAFVVALDDEVIERGIAHRYKDYRFAGKKPEMPITGFEYLEKIVHLPFRLPQMTEGQAREFLRLTESALIETAIKRKTRSTDDPRWFFPEVAVPSIETGVVHAELGRTTVDDNSPLLDMLLRAMENHVPRKLIRTTELLYQYDAIARRRGNLLDYPRAEIKRPVLDIRVVFALMLFQLFQPELFRFFRRRPQAFVSLLSAFATQKFDRTDVSDADLFGWVLFDKDGGRVGGLMPATPERRQQQVAKLEESQRYDAEQLRLPLAELLHDHRQAHRHSFNPLKVMFVLAEQLGSQAEALDLRPYLSFLSAIEMGAEKAQESATGLAAHEFAAVVGTVEAVTGGQTVAAFATAGRRHGGRRSTGIEPGTLYLGFIADDAARRKDLPRVLELAPGEVLDAALVDELATKVAKWADGNQARSGNVLLGLAELAPWLDQTDNGSKKLWELARGALPASLDALDLAALAHWAAPLGSLHQANWQAAADDYKKMTEELIRRMQDKDADGKQRREAGLILGKVGWLPPDLDDFVRIEKGSFFYGDPPEQRKIAADFAIAKYPVTNAQFKAFIEAGGYDNPDYWDEAGKAWLAQSKRKAPRFWNDEQWNNPIFPVVGVSWHEAQAYCRWYSATRNEPVRLATEEEWERAARGKDGRIYPWGKDFDKRYANTKESGVNGTTAVCTYPEGKSVSKVWDMSGNVFEWTGKPWDTEKSSYVLRGGSYWTEAGYARCAVRDGGHPVVDGDSIGLRLVLSLVNSET